MCFVYLLGCAGAYNYVHVCVYALRIVSPDTILRCGNTFLLFLLLNTIFDYNMFNTSFFNKHNNDPY